MAYQAIIGTTLKRINLRPLLSGINNSIMRVRQKSDIMPPQPFLQKPHSMFSSKVILHHFGVIPIILFTICGVTCEALWTLRLALTRHDVCYAGLMPYERQYNRIKKNKAPPVGKFRVYNDKYIYPKGLIEAVRAGDKKPEE